MTEEEEYLESLAEDEGDRAFTAEYERGESPGQCPRCGRLACRCKGGEREGEQSTH